MSNFDRRDFLRQAGAVAVGTSMASAAMAKSSGRASRTSATSSGRVLGANDRINVGIIGAGGRGYGGGTLWVKIGAENNSCQVVGVADTYQKRVNKAKEGLKCESG